MPAASEDVWRILFTVSRYLIPLLAAVIVLLLLVYILSESRLRRDKAHGIPGFGTVGELIVLSGSHELDTNTWFPVPREGVLGSIRSCDLVIPCPGVHMKHLDFSWEDGFGLLIRPRSGCEVLVDGRPVTCRTDASAVPLTHGSVLQVGSAVLRLHLFAALDNTASSVQPSCIPQQDAAAVMPDVCCPFHSAPEMQVPQEQSLPISYETACNEYPPEPSLPSEQQQIPDMPAIQNVSGNRSDRWKEDLGE